MRRFLEFIGILDDGRSSTAGRIGLALAAFVVALVVIFWLLK